MKSVCEIAYHTQTSVMQPLKLWNGLVISSHTLLGIHLLIHSGIETLLKGALELRSVYSHQPGTAFSNFIFTEVTYGHNALI